MNFYELSNKMHELQQKENNGAKEFETEPYNLFDFDLFVSDNGCCVKLEFVKVDLYNQTIILGYYGTKDDIENE